MKKCMIIAVIFFIFAIFLSCSRNITLTKANYKKMDKIHAVWTKTADIEFKTVGSVIGSSLIGLGGLLTIPAGLIINEASTGKVENKHRVPDLGELVLKKIVETAKKELPGWPCTTFEQLPVNDEYANKKAYILMVNVSQFWVTLYGGLTITTRATLYDSNKNIIWSKDFWYRSRDFEVKKSLEEYSAENAQMLIVEIPFAAERIAIELVKDLRKTREEQKE